jgi:hypothetical protein
MKVINLFAGPGCGKSTTAAALFALMKRRGLNVEMITEFAKDLVWTERNKELGDQIYIFGKMYHKLWRLRDKVDYVITDSPLPFCYYYDRENIQNFKELVMSAFNSFYNINFVLERNFPYQQEGRYQTEEEARKVHLDILKMIEDNNITIDRSIHMDNDKFSFNAEEVILRFLEQKGEI